LSAETDATEDSSESSTTSYSKSSDSSESIKAEMTEDSLSTESGEATSSPGPGSSSSAAEASSPKEQETTTQKMETTTEKLSSPESTTTKITPTEEDSKDYGEEKGEVDPNSLNKATELVTEGSGAGSDASEIPRAVSTFSEEPEEGLLTSFSTEAGSGMSTFPELMISDGPASTDWEVSSIAGKN